MHFLLNDRYQSSKSYTFAIEELLGDTEDNKDEVGTNEDTLKNSEDGTSLILK